MSKQLIILISLVALVAILLSVVYIPTVSKSSVPPNSQPNGQPNGQPDGDHISRLALKIDILVDHMNRYAYPSSDVSKRLYYRWKVIRNDPDGLAEIPASENVAAYTISKSKIRICLKNKYNKYEDENTMIFVMLHELGHLMSESLHHTIEFKENFSFIVQKAIELNLYKFIPFSQNPTTFCGVDIKNSPV